MSELIKTDDIYATSVNHVAIINSIIDWSCNFEWEI